MSILIYNVKLFGAEGEYVLVNKGRIEKVGSCSPPSAGRKIDGKGALLLPGFCDSHTHLSNIALMHGTLDLTNKKREEVLELVANECKKRKLVIGRGWDESFWERKEYLNADEIDAVCPDSMVFLIREDGHLAVVNSKVKKEYGFGDEDGIIREDEISKLSKKLHAFESLNFEYAQNFALSRGVTCVHDFATLDTMRKYMEMHLKGALKLRIFMNFYQDTFPKIKELGMHTGFGDEYLKIGALKLFSDGSIGAGNAATRYADGRVVEPFLDENNLNNIVKDANSHGIRVFTHAIGDFAIENVIKAYKGTEGNRIEHFELVRDEFLEDMPGISVSMQPNFLKWAKRGGLYHAKLGAEWLERNNPYRKIIASGIPLLFGSDCMPLDPLFGIEMATNSEYSSQRISFEEAAKAYTLGAKYMHRDLGEIKDGKLADLVAIKDGKVEFTMVEGKIEYSALMGND